MLAGRIAKNLFANAKREIVPKPPKFLSGELEPFKFNS